MKRFPLLIFCVCVIFSSVCWAETGNRRDFAAFSMTGKNEFPNIFRPVGKIFKKLFGRKRGVVDHFYNVDTLILSKTEIFATCSSAGGSADDRSIEVTATASHGNLSLDAFDIDYRYQVSGGKIVGEGAKVRWDLSSVKPGTYTIIAAVDPGCGVCGRTVTKEVKVIECPSRE
jgi:hypothetical protein